MDKPQVTIFPASNKIVLTGSQAFVTVFSFFFSPPALANVFLLPNAAQFRFLLGSHPFLGHAFLYHVSAPAQ